MNHTAATSPIPSAPRVPDFSIVIETENLDRASTDELLGALRSIDRQTLHPSGARQVLLMNAGQVPSDVVADISKRYDWLTVVEAAPGTGYYELKMEGFRRTSGKIVVFLDSDVAFSAQCVEALVDFLSTHPDEQIVCGETTIAPNGVFELIVLLTWAFPPRSGRALPYRTVGYPANQFAVRRGLLERYPIPTALDLPRGNCRVHAIDLARHNIAIWKHPAAGASHPLIPPHTLPTRLFFMGHGEISSAALAGHTGMLQGIARRLRFSAWRIPRRLLMPFYRLLVLMRNGEVTWRHVPAAVPAAIVGSLVTISGMLYGIVRPGGRALAPASKLANTRPGSSGRP